MVYTSADIRALHWVQRVFPPAYELAMRLAQLPLRAARGPASARPTA